MRYVMFRISSVGNLRLIEHMNDRDSIPKDGRDESSDDEIHKLRRFALGTALALFVYVLGGGELRDELSAPLATIIRFRHPDVLLVLLVITTAYAAFRYWYHAIYLSLTRAKIRAYLETEQSILIFPNSEDDFSHKTEPATGKGSVWWQAINTLLTKLPNGLPRSRCIVIGHIGDNREHMSKAVATKLNHYFPGLTPENVSLVCPGEGVYWAHISSRSSMTRWSCLSEDFDLWLPVYAAGLSIALLVGSKLWPWMSVWLYKL